MPTAPDTLPLSAFEIEVYTAEIQPHPSAGAIELCHVGGYRPIVAENTILNGAPVVHIPEAAVMLLCLITGLRRDGKLTGASRKRIKPIRLRGIYRKVWSTRYPTLP